MSSKIGCYNFNNKFARHVLLDFKSQKCLNPLQYPLNTLKNRNGSLKEF